MSRLDEVLSSLKISWAVIATAFSSNAALAIGLIPENIGKVGVLITTITAIVVFTVQLKNLKIHQETLLLKQKESLLKDIEIEHARFSLDNERRQHTRRIEDELP